MSAPVRVAVVGVGALGQHHARILASMDAVELVGVVDIDGDRAAALATKHGTQPFTEPGAVLGRVDAVIVAVPTVAHLEVAVPFLQRGTHVLVEKPMAASLAEADELIATADAGNALLAVGHTERFNPAIHAIQPLIREPRFVEVHRLGAFPGRSLDIDVVFDLMIHDLDVLLALVRSEVVSVEAVGVAVLTTRADIANARIRFASGCIANVTASRISRDRIRKIRFFQHNSYVSVDYAAREAEAYSLGAQDGRPAILGGPLEVQKDEPLMRELVDFIGAVQARRAPLVTGRDGRAALALATAIADQMAEAT